MSAVFTGIGVGPGDPLLITVKAWRSIQQADVISYIANTDGNSQAKEIAREALAEVQKVQTHIPVKMPMLEDRHEANKVYDQAAIDIQSELDAGKNVVFLCEGDPLFFGSFAYLLERLERNKCEVIPGISSIHAAAAALKTPLTMLKESFAITSGRQTDDQLQETLLNNDSVVIMKAGRARQRILQALIKTKRTEDAQYIEYIGRSQQKIISDVNQLGDENGPYFSLFLVTDKSRSSR